MAQQKKAKLLHFGVVECDEHVIMQFDYSSFLLNKWHEGVKLSTVSFNDIENVITNANTKLDITFSKGETASYGCLSSSDCASLFELCNTIKKNKCEIISKDTTNIETLCTNMLPKICLRKINVLQKSIKKKGKGKSLFKKKKPTKDASVAKEGSTKNEVGILVMTESQLLCFEEKNLDLPLYILPLRGLDFSATEEKDLSFTSSNGTKFSFHCETVDDRALFLDAREKARQLTEKEIKTIKAKVDFLRSFYCRSFDKERADDVKLLHDLWDYSLLGEGSDGEKIEFQVQCNRWKDLGFQRDDPISDLRATGTLGLQNLVYFAQNHSSIFLDMARNQQQASEMEYPFCTAGINLTFLLVDIFQLKPQLGWYPSFVAHPMLFYDINAWEELYCIIFRLFDQKWNQMLVGYMGFQKVIDSVKESVEEFLGRETKYGIPAIFEMFGILLEDISAFKCNSEKRQELAAHKFPDRGAIGVDAVTTSSDVDSYDEHDDDTEDEKKMTASGNWQSVAPSKKEGVTPLDIEKKDPNSAATSDKVLSPRFNVPENENEDEQRTPKGDHPRSLVIVDSSSSVNASTIQQQPQQQQQQIDVSPKRPSRKEKRKSLSLKSANEQKVERKTSNGSQHPNTNNNSNSGSQERQPVQQLSPPQSASDDESHNSKTKGKKNSKFSRKFMKSFIKG